MTRARASAAKYFYKQGDKMKLKSAAIKWAIGAVGGISAAGAMAQSSVSIYGIVDVGVEYVNKVPPSTGGHVLRLTSGGQAGSRLGFRGTEDLGGGSKAFFALESGFGVDTGIFQQGGRSFGRLSYVGLEGPYGAVSFGRHRNAIFDVAIPFDPMAYNLYSVFSQDAVMGGRTDNSIRYLGNQGAWSYSAQYSFGYDATISNGSEVTDYPRVGREWGGSLVYTTSTLSAMLAYDERRGVSVATQNDAFKRTVLAATYDFGTAKAFLGARDLRQTGSAPLKAMLIWAGLSYQVTPLFTVVGAVYRTDVKNSSADATAYSLSALYSLSKRTSLYANVARTNNSGVSSLGVVGAGTAVPGSNQSGFIVGIKHNF
jgi:predicted porin